MINYSDNFEKKSIIEESAPSSVYNELIKDYCSKNYNMHYIETKDFFLNKNGTPNNNLFRRDLLHLNDKGYNIWNNIIKEKILSIKK